MNIFEIMFDKYKITKPIRLIELFGGYGSQHFSLKYLGANVESWRIVEWAVPSIQAYKDAHFPTDNFDYSSVKSFEVIVDILFDKGISINYNEPMTKEQIQRKGEKWCRQVFNNICATNNLVNIQNVKGSDLEIIDTDKYDYIMTYSFPCQDLSLAGKRLGMSDTSTRSGMLWEVERILEECDNKPQILLMENVPQVIGTDNVEHFNKWQLKLEQLGYKNYHQNLIATDYGIPQTRNRTFMVSILGEYSYTFPQPIPLKLKLKDMLEDNVDEKYYLSDKMKKYIFSEGDKYKVNKNSLKLNRKVACSKTTREGRTRADSSDYIIDNKEYDYSKEKGEIVFKKDTENYIEWEDGKNIQMNCRAWKDDKVIATLNTGGETKILVNKISNKALKETLEKSNQIKDGSFIDSYNKNIRDDDIAGTITTRVSDSNNTFIACEQRTDEGLRTFNNNNMGTLRTTDSGGDKRVIENNLRIRKLTPKECFRLMGVKDEDYENIAKNQSDSSLYHLAGDSLVTTVMMAILSELLGISWQDKFIAKKWFNNDLPI